MVEQLNNDIKHRLRLSEKYHLGHLPEPPAPRWTWPAEVFDAAYTNAMIRELGIRLQAKDGSTYIPAYPEVKIYMGADGAATIWYQAAGGISSQRLDPRSMDERFREWARYCATQKKLPHVLTH